MGKLLTDAAGASRYYRGGVIAYANDVKVAHLGVDESELARHGAVSEPVAEQMATGVAERLGADVGLSVTGVAGPDGGTLEKPVGTVWMAVHTPELDLVLRDVFPGDRAAVRVASAARVLEMVADALT